MTRLPNGGRIEVICGCMFSGKTEELLRRLNHVRLAKQTLAVYAPARHPFRSRQADKPQRANVRGTLGRFDRRNRRRCPCGHGSGRHR